MSLSEEDRQKMNDDPVAFVEGLPREKQLTYLQGELNHLMGTLGISRTVLLLCYAGTVVDHAVENGRAIATDFQGAKGLLVVRSEVISNDEG